MRRSSSCPLNHSPLTPLPPIRSAPVEAGIDPVTAREETCVPFTYRRSTAPSHVVATCVQTFGCSALVPRESCLPPAANATPAGTEVLLFAYRPYTKSPGCSLIAIVCHAAPIAAAGFTQASTVKPVVRSSDVESGTETQLELPLNVSAPPNRPDVDQAVFSVDPVLFCPDASPTVVPPPASKA